MFISLKLIMAAFSVSLLARYIEAKYLKKQKPPLPQSRRGRMAVYPLYV
jgi:hypothetical protein